MRYNDETEAQLTRQLIAERLFEKDTARTEQRLYEHQLRIGSNAVYYTFEKL